MAEEKKEVKEKKAAPVIDEKAKEGRVLAALSYIWVIGLIILLFTKRNNDYVVFHAKQATVLGLGALIALHLFFAAWPILTIITVILGAVSLAGLVMAALGKRFEIPAVKEIASKMTI